jgi:hypothetical protein
VIAVYMDAKCFRDPELMEKVDRVEREHNVRAQAAQKLTKWTEMQFVRAPDVVYSFVLICVIGNVDERRCG